MLMQSLSESPTARKIDSEVRNLDGDQLAGTPRLHYLRYNATLSNEDIALNAKLTAQDHQKFPKVKTVADMMKMDVGSHVFHLAEIGKRAAATSLGAEQFDAHFPSCFDLPRT